MLLCSAAVGLITGNSELVTVTLGGTIPMIAVAVIDGPLLGSPFRGALAVASFLLLLELLRLCLGKFQNCTKAFVVDYLPLVNVGQFIEYFDLTSGGHTGWQWCHQASRVP